MMRTTLFVLLCVAVLVQSMPPSDHVVAKRHRVVRQDPTAEGINAMNTMKGMADTFADGVMRGMGMINPSFPGFPGMNPGMPQMGSMPGMGGARRR